MFKPGRVTRSMLAQESQLDKTPGRSRQTGEESVKSKKHGGDDGNTRKPSNKSRLGMESNIAELAGKLLQEMETLENPGLSPRAVRRLETILSLAKGSAKPERQSHPGSEAGTKSVSSPLLEDGHNEVLDESDEAVSSSDDFTPSPEPSEASRSQAQKTAHPTRSVGRKLRLRKNHQSSSGTLNLETESSEAEESRHSTNAISRAAQEDSPGKRAIVGESRTSKSPPQASSQADHEANAQNDVGETTTTTTSRWENEETLIEPEPALFMSQDDRNSREGTEEIYQRSTQKVRETPSRRELEPMASSTAKRKRTIFDPQVNAQRISPISSSLRGLSDSHETPSHRSKATTRQYESSPIKPVSQTTRRPLKRRRRRNSPDTSSTDSDAFDPPKKRTRGLEVPDAESSDESEGNDIEFKPPSARASPEIAAEEDYRKIDNVADQNKSDGETTSEEYASADSFHDAPAVPTVDETLSHKSRASEQRSVPQASPERTSRPSTPSAVETKEQTGSYRGSPDSETKPAAPRRRRKWSDEETDALKNYIIRYGPRWARIKLADNSSSRPMLMQRDQTNIKDKARQLVVGYYRRGMTLPENFDRVALRTADIESLRRSGGEQEMQIMQREK